MSDKIETKITAHKGLNLEFEINRPVMFRVSYKDTCNPFELASDLSIYSGDVDSSHCEITFRDLLESDSLEVIKSLETVFVSLRKIVEQNQGNRPQSYNHK